QAPGPSASGSAGQELGRGVSRSVLGTRPDRLSPRRIWQTALNCWSWPYSSSPAQCLDSPSTRGASTARRLPMPRSRRPHGESQFENPTAPEPAPGPADADFEEPEGAYESESANVAPSSAEGELTVALSAADSGMMQIKAAIESMLVRQAGPMV